MAGRENIAELDLDAPRAFGEETTPLLGDNLNQNGKENTGKPYVFAQLACFSALIVFGSMVILVPNLEIYRYIVCQQYYAGSGDLDLISLIGQFNGTVHEKCSIDEISRKVAGFNGLVLSIESFFAITVVLIYGKLADRYGRKLPLYIVLIGSVASQLWCVFVVKRARVWGINALLLAPIISGLTGASPTIRTVLYSMVCDCFSGGARLVAMSYITAILMLVASAGPAAGSWLLKKGLLWPSFVGIGIYGVSLLLVYCIPETHPQFQSDSPQARQEETSRSIDNNDSVHADLPQIKVSLASSLKDSLLDSLSSMRFFGQGRNFILLGITAFTFSFSVMAMLVVLQFLNKEFNWSMIYTGYYYSAYNAAKIVVLLVILPAYTRIMLKRMSSAQVDLVTVKISLLTDALAYIGYGVMTSVAWLPPTLFLQSLAAPGLASLKVLISNLVPSEEIGSIFAAFSVLEGIGEMLGPSFIAYVYSATIATHAGAVFLVVGGMYLFGFLVTLFLRDSESRSDAQPSTVEPAA